MLLKELLILLYCNILIHPSIKRVPYKTTLHIGIIQKLFFRFQLLHGHDLLHGFFHAITAAI